MSSLCLSRVRRWVGGLHMGTKIRMIYVLACVLPCVVAGAQAILSTRDMLLEQRSQAVLEKHLQTKVAFSNAATVCVNVSTGLMFDEDLRRLLTDAPKMDDAQVRAALRRLKAVDSALKNYPQLAGIAIYTDCPALAGRGPFLPVDEAVRAADWFRAAAGSRGVIRWYAGPPEAGGSLRLVRELPLGGGRFAVLVLGMSDAHLRLQFADGGLETAIYLEDGQGFYASRPGLMEAPPLDRSAGRAPRAAVWGGAEALACQSEAALAGGGGSFLIATADPAAPGLLRATVRRLATLMAALLVTALALVLFYSVRVGRRVAVLRDQMRAVANGSLSVPLAVPPGGVGEDELDQLFADMTRTVRVLQNLNREVYEKELRYQRLLRYQTEMDYKMLLSQVNPHFLFNTLESIRMKAVMNGDREVAQVVHKLGQIMRRLLKAADRTVRLDGELGLVRDYLDIQQFRHAERITYEMRCGEGVEPERLYVLPLLLLPLAENAVLHGLENKRGAGVIRIEAALDGDDLRITVADNGVGMDARRQAEVAQRLAAGREALGGEGIGLNNVHQRIRLSYGSAYGLRIESAPGAGTRVEVLLPVRRGGAQEEAEAR